MFKTSSKTYCKKRTAHAPKLVVGILCMRRLCCCLPCNHFSNWAWVVEDSLAFWLRSTHCREFLYLKLYNLVKYIIRHGLPNNQTSVIHYWTDFTSIVMSSYLLHFNQGE